MAVSSVRITADVFWVCLNHAFTTEKEEVMGLLIGEIDEKKILNISAVIVLKRSDKRPDRVEISPEQLSDAAIKAEGLTSSLGRPMRVLGWYHSHPRITVWPSHVDCRTQGTYQLMDKAFIGIIFSVFNEEKPSKLGKVQVTCFQSTNNVTSGDQSHKEVKVPLHIVPITQLSQICLESVIDLPTVLYNEEKAAYDIVVKNPDLDVLARLHNNAVCTRALCNITEVTSIPVIQMLENRLKNNLNRIEELKREINENSNRTVLDMD